MATNNNYFTGPGPATIVQGNARNIISKVNVLHRCTLNPSIYETNRGVHYNLKLPVASFTGRHHELKDLEKLLQHDNEDAPTSAVIIGLGGTGKTELARKYAHENSIYYKNIVWVDSETAANIQYAFETLAKDHLSIFKDKEKCRIEVTITKVYEHLSESKTLFIFDNAEGYAKIEGFLPPFIKRNIKNIHILFTSQMKEWEVMDENNIKKIFLNELLPEEAKEFVKKSLTQNNFRDREIEKLIEELACFPLALTQAVAYINQQHQHRQKLRTNESYGIVDYLKDFSDQPISLLDHDNEIHHRYANTVFKTLELTFEKLSKEKNGQEAEDVITIIAYLAPDNINICKMFSVDENTFLLLDKYSLIKIMNGVASIHRLLQQVIRLRNKDHEVESLRKALIAVKKIQNNIWYNGDGHAILVWSYAVKHNVFIQEATWDSKSRPLHLFAEYDNYEAAQVMLANIHANKLKHISNYGEDDEDIYYDALNQSDADNICNQKDYLGDTPLLLACKSKTNLNMLKLLIENDSNVNVSNYRGETPLHLAAFYNALDIIKLLIESGSDVNAVDFDGTTPLLAAAHNNASFEIIKSLITSGANVNVKNKKFGSTPLHEAADYNENVDVLKILIESGSDVHAVNKFGATPLHRAARFNMNYLHLKIMDSAHIYGQYDESGAIINEATYYNANFAIIKFLIESGSDVNAADDDGATPLLIAAHNNANFETLKFLVASGADVNVKDKNGGTLTDYAFWNWSENIKNFVIEKKCNLTYLSK